MYENPPRPASTLLTTFSARLRLSCACKERLATYVGFRVRVWGLGFRV